MDQVNPFIVDGPVPTDSPLYIERDADRHLLKLIMDSEIIYLVGSPYEMLKVYRLNQTAEI